MVSFSLNYLSMPDLLCYVNEMNSLFRSTPNLQYLCVRTDTNNQLQQLSLSVLSIKKIRLSWNNSRIIMTDLLKNMLNLSHLRIETTCIYMDGHYWERIISTYLSKLKTFRLKMDIDLGPWFGSEEEFHRLLSTFTTPFWIKEHQWFIRCDCYLQRTRSPLCLYTVPYAFDTFHIHPVSFGRRSLSTSPKINNQQVYNCVRTLIYDPSSDSEGLFDFIFSNISHLVINLLYNEHLFSLVPKLKSLSSLDVTIYEYDRSPQLQVLLDQAPHLYSLTIKSFDRPSSVKMIIESTSTSVRRLDLQGYIPYSEYFCFDEELCFQFSQSPLGRNCEILSITVENQSNIICLIENMINLRTLHVKSRDNQRANRREFISTEEDELVDWLKVRLSATCTIIRDGGLQSSLRLWIH